MTDEIEATTTVHAPRADVYALIQDVEGYADYSGYVREVARNGDGGVGTTYDVTLSWWRLTYTARFRVTDLNPPDRIDWRLVEDLDARVTWRLEPADVEEIDVEEHGVDHATRVTLTARYDPDSADDDALSLPPFVPMSTVVGKARPVVEREAQRVLNRVVADLEDEPREATLTIRTRPDAG